MQVDERISLKALIDTLIPDKSNDDIFGSYQVVINNKVAGWEVLLKSDDNVVIYLPLAGG